MKNKEFKYVSDESLDLNESGEIRQEGDTEVIDVEIEQVKEKAGKTFSLFINQLSACLKNIRNEKLKEKAVDKIISAIEAYQKFIKFSLSLAMVVGALSKEPHTNWTTSEKKEREYALKLLKDSPNHSYIITEDADEHGKSEFSHSDPATTESLNYLSGKTGLPEEIKKQYLIAYLIERVSIYEEEKQFLPNNLEELSLNELEKVYSRVVWGKTKIDPVEQFERDKLFLEKEIYPKNEYDPNFEIAIWRTLEEAGSPRVVLYCNSPKGDFFSNNENLNVDKYLEYLTFHRSHYFYDTNTLMLEIPVGTVLFDKYKMSRKEYEEFSFLQELAHHVKVKSDPVDERVKAIRDRVFIEAVIKKTGKHYDAAYLELYDRNSTGLEYEVHKKIYPVLKKRFDNSKRGNR